MKVAPLYHALVKHGHSFEPRIIHTGQHYDAKLSDVFFADLDLPAPHVNLEVGSGPVAQQTGRVMEAYERHLGHSRPDVTLVVGDVNSTIGCGLAAVHARVPLVHLEAGLRSFDRTMPEEINRLLTDRIADLLLVPSEDAVANLRREGIPDEQIRFVGNIMIDALEAHLSRAEASTILADLNLEARGYGLVTLHRPSNVDAPDVLAGLLLTLAELAGRLPLLVSTHPRLRKNLQALDGRIRHRIENSRGLKFVDPLGYVDFLALELNSRVALTDSGGVQEETTVLGIPCLTLRETTERPITVHEGTNRLVGRDPDQIKAAFAEILALPMPVPCRPVHWDGHTAGRVVTELSEFYLKCHAKSNSRAAPKVLANVKR
jgi:UDP-N-acetylglucosamine 2-epimerase (non-hydrolysing)